MSAALAIVLCAGSIEAQTARDPATVDYQFRVHGYVQSDGRIYPSGAIGTPTTSFVMKRVRPVFEVSILDRFQARVMPDFGEGRFVLQDAYVDVALVPSLKLRAGKFKSPFGLERLMSATELLVIERGAPTSLAPNRDVGVMLQGQPRSQRLSWALAFVNGVADGGSGDADTRSGNDVIGRLFVKPFGTSAAAALRGLSLGGAFSAGSDKGTATDPGVPSFRTSGQQVFFRFRGDGTASGTTITDGGRLRSSIQATWYSGPFEALGEATWSDQRLRIGTSSERMLNRAWMITGGVVVTGEPASPRGVAPAAAFDPGRGQWGALEIVTRFAGTNIDEDAYPTFANAAVAARGSLEWAAGANWYLNRFVKVSTSFHSTTFDGGSTNGDRPAERLILARLQLSF